MVTSGHAIAAPAASRQAHSSTAPLSPQPSKRISTRAIPASCKRGRNGKVGHHGLDIDHGLPPVERSQRPFAGFNRQAHAFPLMGDAHPDPALARRPTGPSAVLADLFFGLDTRAPRRPPTG